MAKIKKADSTAREDVEQSELRHTGGRIKCYNLFGQWFAGFLCGLTQQLSPMCLYKRNKTHAHKKIYIRIFMDVLFMINPDRKNANSYQPVNRRQWRPTPVHLPGKSHGRRSLVGCSPGGRWESDTTDRLHFHFSLSCIGGGSGNPLQCSCLENPRDGGAWWAAV